MKTLDNNSFKKVCNQVRKNILNLLYNAGSGHAGSSLSIVELMVYLYFNQIKFEKKKKIDKLILSKGHAVPCLYSVLMEKKIIKKHFASFRKLNSELQGHPDTNFLNHLDLGTGALGQGLSVAIGYLEGAKLNKINLNSYCVLGDGELQEGQIWEAAMYIGSKKLSNICTIIDKNKFQNELSTKKTLDLGNIKKKFESFNFKVLEVDGHSFYQLKKVFHEFNKIKKPICIICNTIKGKGIKFMEKNNIWHSKKLDAINYMKAMKYLK